jgi:hypothetical protein
MRPPTRQRLTRGQKIFCALYAAGWLYVTGMHIARADEAPPAPKAADPSEVTAVMFYITISRKDGHWTHAQVIGGYKDHDDCMRAVPMVGAATSGDLSPDDVPVFLCPEVDVEGILKKQAEPELAPSDPTPLRQRTETPSSDT